MTSNQWSNQEVLTENLLCVYNFYRNASVYPINSRAPQDTNSSSIDKDSLLDQTLMGLLQALFPTGLWHWASVFLLVGPASPGFSKNPI